MHYANMEKAQTDRKNNVSTENPCQKAKVEPCKKDVQHGRVNKESSQNKYHIRGTASQSTIEYTKCGEPNKSNTGQRSKSFLEESGLSKETLTTAQGNQCSKRGTQGSHGDGLFYPVQSSNGKRSTLTDVPEKSEDVHKKSQVQKAILQTNSTGVVTHRLFESPLSFAELVRKGPTTQKTGDPQRIQLNNTLLSTPQGSTEVSNYLNKYRSYLDNLRKTYGKGTHQFHDTRLRSAATIRPQVFPFPHMIHDIYDATKDDPDFRQLLEKTTTQSIRNLWPQTNQTRAQYNSALCGFGQFSDEKSDYVNNVIGSYPTLQSETQHQENIAADVDCEESNINGKTNDSKTSSHSLNINNDVNKTKDTGEESVGITDMKTCGDAFVYQMRENIGATSSSMAKPGHAQFQPLRKVNESMAMSRDTTALTGFLHQANSSDWVDGTKRPNNSCLSFKLQNQSALDNLLKHQQMLLQKKQLQNQHHHNQQQQQHEQQQQQLQQPQEMTAMSKNENFQTGVFHPRSSGSLSNSNSSHLNSSLGHHTYSVGTEHPMGIPYPGTLESKTRHDSSHLNMFGENLGHSQSTSMTAGNTEGFAVQGARAGQRTLKASYACLDPSMALMTKPANDSEYMEGGDNFCFSTYISPGERLASEENQFSSGMYNADERCDTAWALGKQYGQPINQALPLEKAVSKAKISTDSYDLCQQIPWSNSSRTPHCSLVKMNSDSNLDRRLPSQNISRQRDEADANSGCFNTLNNNNGEHQIGMWSAYQQNVNTNRTNTTVFDRGDGGVRQENSSFNDGTVFGSSRILQWRNPNPVSPDSDFAECQDKMVGSTRMVFQKVHQDDASAVGTGSFNQNSRTITNSLGWNANVVVSTSKAETGNCLNPTAPHIQTSREDDCLFSYYPSQGSKYNYLFNNNNASSDAIGQFQTPDPAYLKERTCSGIGETSEYFRNRHTSALFPNKNMVSEKYDVVTDDNILQESVSEGQDLSTKMLPVPLDAMPSTAMTTDQQPQNSHDIVDGDEHFENHHDSVLFNGHFPKPSTTSNLQQQRSTQSTVSDFTSKSDDRLLNQLSENLERTSMSGNQQFGTSDSPPWYELAPAPNEMEGFKINLENSKILGLHKNASYLTDHIQTMSHGACSGIDVNGPEITAKCEKDQHNTCENQSKSRPRMILGVNAPKSFLDTKRSNDTEDSNRKLREILGINPPENDLAKEGSVNDHLSSKVRSSEKEEASPTYQTANNSAFSLSGIPHNYHGNQLPHFQVSGNRVPMNMAQQMQQMYCVPNILLPPHGQGHHTNLVSAPGVMTNVGSSTRLPHGMMRLPLVDMSRFVYLQPFPVNVTPSHTTSNNHNNSSSSNPHVNTSNIITINTSENDFSINSDRSGRAPKTGGGRSKPGLNRVRSGTGEIQIPVYGMRSNDEASMSKGSKVRTQNTNPWDQDLEHDFSSTYFSKIKKVDHGNTNSDVGFMFPEMVCSQQVNNTSGIPESRFGTSSFMQWSMIPEKYPEMLDMLAVKKPMSDECNTGRLCWPDMEFMMSSSKEQLQAVRKSNKPLGSNKANLISILPKGRAIDSCDGRIKEGVCLDKGENGIK